MQLTDLPAELVRNILSYVPSRRNAALVCKNFYEHVCFIERNYYTLSINLNIHFKLKYIKTLLMSNRRISEICITENEGRINQHCDLLFEKFGRNVRKLSLKYCVVSEKQLLHWLTMMPSLEEIDCHLSDINYEQETPIPVLYLPRLKKVAFRLCAVGERQNIINALPPGTIQELSWTNDLQETKATSFLQKQMNIKNLTLGCHSLADIEVLDQLNLSKLTVSIDFAPVSIEMIVRQRNLTTLILNDVPVDSNMFISICRMKNLTSLMLNISGVPSTVIAHLERLKLKALTMNYGDKYQLQAIRSIEMPSVEFLTLRHFEGLDNCWDGMGTRFVNLKKVRYGDCFNLAAVEKLMQEFPKLDSIDITMNASAVTSYDVSNRGYDAGRIKYFNIFSNRSTFIDVIPFLDVCINLEEIFLFAPLHINFLRHILTTHPKIRTLVMTINNRSFQEGYELLGKIRNALEWNAPHLETLILSFQYPADFFMFGTLKETLIDRFPIIIEDPSILTFKKRGVKATEHFDEGPYQQNNFQLFL